MSFRGSALCGVEAGGHSEKRRRRKASSFMAWVLGGFWKEGGRTHCVSVLEPGAAPGLDGLLPEPFSSCPLQPREGDPLHSGTPGAL